MGEKEIKRFKKPINFLVIFILLVSYFVFLKTNPSRDIKIKDEKINEHSQSSTIENIEIKKEIISMKDRTSEISLLAVGDIMYHMPQVKAARRESGYDFNENFVYVKDLITSSDIAICNFETVVGGKEYAYSGFPLFNSPEETLDSIKYAGFDLISTINNHTIDMGQKGIINTINKIENLGLKSIGSYKKEDDPRTFIFEKDKVKLGFMAYSYGFNGNYNRLGNNKFMVNKIDKQAMLKDIEELKEEEVDLIISIIHWGVEYSRNPSQEQRELANFLHDEGVDIILGSHPHVIQPVLRENDKLTIFSMGNFLSNQRLETLNNPYTEDGLIVKIKIKKDLNKNNTIFSEEYIASWVYKYIGEKGYRYTILPVDAALEGSLDLELDKETRNRLERSKRDTLSIINKKLEE